VIDVLYSDPTLALKNIVKVGGVEEPTKLVEHLLRSLMV
jgi:hypothetical protein